MIGDGVAVQVNIGTPPNNEHAGADMTRLDDPAIPGLDSAVIIINPGITDCTALAQTMAHEIGHLLGLDDCLSCEEGTSVMTGVLCETEGNCNLNDTTNGRVAPSECDNNAAKQQYPSPTPTPSSSPPPSCLISCEPTPPPPPRSHMDQDGYALEDDPADCNDEDPLIHPNATTMCEAMDRNCNWIDDRSEPDPISCGSPVLIDLAGNGFDLTSSDQGVWFNLTGVGAMKWSWTATQSDDAWLVLDRNDDGIISDGSELFGCITQQTRTATPNGFIALAEYDKFPNGGNRDGMIDSADSVFANLRLWQDMNHNGISEPYEILPLSSADILAIDLDYKEAGRRDRHGNRFRYRAKIHSGNNSTVQRWAWDVFLTLQP